MKPFKHPLKDRLRYLFGEASLATRANTFGAILNGKMNRTKLCTKPWMLQIEVTNRCNMNCIMCSRSSTKMTLGDMSPEVIDRCVEVSKDTQETALFGYGEPLMSTSFITLLRRLQSSHVGFFTNGLLLNDAMLTKILDASACPLSYIVISMDGATAGTYEGIRLGSKFDVVWDNIRNAVKRREREGLHHIIRLEFVAMTRNIHELPDLVKLAANTGVDGIKVSHLVVWDESLRKESLIDRPSKCERYFTKAKNEATQRGIYLDVPKLLSHNSKPDPTDPYPPCHAPWHYAMISFEGDVRACCFSPQFTMGNILDKPFSEIWTSKQYNALRSTVNSKTPPAACQMCEERFRYAISPDEARTYIKLTPRKK